MTPRVWLDCTSLMNWQFSHFTGIQRTVLGIHKGWIACGIKPLLFRYDAASAGFVEVNPEDLSEVIRRNLESQEWISVDRDLGLQEASPTEEGRADEMTTAFDPNKRRSIHKRIARRLLGAGPAAEDLRMAVGDLNLAIWKIPRTVLSWLSYRLSLADHHASKSTYEHANNEEKSGQPRPIEVSHEDYLFSIGSECFQISDNFQAAKELRNRGAKLIRMIYDVIPALQPQWVDEITQKVFTEGARSVISSSDHILTISNYSRKQILEFADAQGLITPPITTIRLGDTVLAMKSQIADIPGHVQRPSRPFFLTLGTVEPRKNHRLLYSVWRILAAQDPDGCPDLVCIGAQHLLCKQLVHEMSNDPLVKHRIHLLQDVSDNRLEWYYDQCMATVFPSMYEGWGLPVAESLVRGRVCLASNTTSIPEVGGDLVLYFNPEDQASLIILVRRIQTDPEWRAAVERKIRIGYTSTPWKHTAQQTLQAIESMYSHS
jgi:glycosyltransferase involved in cell wall biosynthesis